MAAISKEEYLKRYLSGSDYKTTKKKTKKVKPAQKTGLKIVDDDDDFQATLPDTLNNALEDDIHPMEDAPAVADVIDERPNYIRQLEQYRADDARWKVMGKDEEKESPKKKLDGIRIIGQDDMSEDEDSDTSPVRSKRRHDSDSDQEVRHDSESDSSPPRKARHDSESDQSPKNTARHDSDSDQSPVRDNRDDSDSDQSPVRKSRKDSDSDQSPVRKSRKDSDSDQSPVRKSRKNSDSDQSPVRKSDSHSHKSKLASDSKRRGRDLSPQRQKPSNEGDKKPRVKKSRWSPEKDSKGRAQKTLSGATAGLSSAKEMKHEASLMRNKETDAFSKIDDRLLGKDAVTVFRDKSGKRRNLEAEEEDEEEKEAIKAAMEAKYAQWGKGLKQVEQHQTHLEDAIHEISKPLARYAGDEDLDAMLKDQDRDGDPMLAFIKKKKSKTSAKQKPMYRGPMPAPNRFKLPPGYRWDGVDRSNGFEKKLFSTAADKKATAELAHKWSVEDM